MKQEIDISQIKFDENKNALDELSVNLNFTDMTKETFGQWIRSNREDRKLSQDELAQQVGTTKQNISNIELDKTDQPRRKHLYRLAKVFGLSRYDMIATYVEKHLKIPVLPKQWVQYDLSLLNAEDFTSIAEFIEFRLSKKINREAYVNFASQNSQSDLILKTSDENRYHDEQVPEAHNDEVLPDDDETHPTVEMHGDGTGTYKRGRPKKEKPSGSFPPKGNN